jgi:hypothetical protein
MRDLDEDDYLDTHTLRALQLLGELLSLSLITWHTRRIKTRSSAIGSRFDWPAGSYSASSFT